MIRILPILRGKDAEDFYSRFVENAKPDSEKAKQIKKDIEIYRRCTKERNEFLLY